MDTVFLSVSELFAHPGTRHRPSVVDPRRPPPLDADSSMVAAALRRAPDAIAESARADMVLYDALYAWCRHARAETHGWHPETMR
jgi:hypothetical protein